MVKLFNLLLILVIAKILNMMKVLLWSVVILGGLLILFLVTAPEAKNNSPGDTPTAKDLSDIESIEIDADSENKPKLIIGDPDAKVTLVEYGDFKCPSCNSFKRNAGEQIRKTYIDGNQVNIEFRNFPFIGPDSGRAARGAYCANDQSVFAEYHDLVYDFMWDNFYEQGQLSVEIEDVLTSDQLVEIMTDTISDTKKFKDCLESSVYNKFIDADLLLGVEDDISGTPAFTIGGHVITGPQNFNTFKTLIDIQLQ